MKFKTRTRLQAHNVADILDLDKLLERDQIFCKEFLTKFCERSVKYLRLASLKSLGTNVPFLMMNLAVAMEGGSITFVGSYILKYAEEMFQVSSTVAALSSGAVLIIAWILNICLTKIIFIVKNRI